jgi:alpha-tubulin suppressor-like RCC1 family protein
MNKWGQLGDGTHTNSASAVRVRQPAGVQFVALDAGGDNACGLTAAGQAYCWGVNWMHGAVGDGTYVDRSTPPWFCSLLG